MSVAWSTLPDADVLAGRDLVGGVVLEHHAELAAQLLRVVLADIEAVDQDLARVRVVEAAQQLDDRRLAGAVASDQRHRLPRLDGEGDVVQGRGVAVRVGYVTLRNSIPCWKGRRTGTGFSGAWIFGCRSSRS